MFLAYAISHYVLPGHSNNQKAKLLHASTVFVFILSLIFYQIVLQVLPISGLKILGYAANIPPEKVVALTNQKRVDAGLSSLIINPLLSQAAQAKGADMLNKGYWAHFSPDGTQPWKFITDTGYKYRFAGENLARDFSNPEAAVEAWMSSPSHRENLLSSKYKEIGLAVVEGELGGVDTTIIVQFFGTQYVDITPQLPIARAETAVVEEVTVSLSPTPAPELSPEPTAIAVAPVASTGIVEPPTSQVLISPFSTTKGISLITVFLLLSVLVVDGIITHRRKVVRIGGRTFAHLAFLGMILAIALIAKAGSIL